MRDVTGRWRTAVLCVALVATACQQAPRPTPAPSAAVDVVKLPGNAGPTAMTLTADGTLWVAEPRIGALAEVDPTGRVTQHRVPGRTVEPDAVLAAPDGRIWYTANGRLGWIDRARGFVTWDGGEGPRRGRITGLAVGPDGAIWFTSHSPTRTVQRAHPTQGIRVVTSLSGTAHRFPEHGLATGPDRAVWFTLQGDRDTDPDGIGRVGHDGRHASWPLPARANPNRIVAGPDGALWFTERHGIGRITVGGVVSHVPVPVPTTEHIRDIVSGPDDALWFVTDTQVGRLRPTGTPELWPVPGAKRLSAVVAAPDGSLRLADARTNRVLRFPPPS
ncbi:hypothetical protein [Micromonospora sp. NPDC047074]|uniref:Vgb family protein n=1 Tax=Micromonospora sp. NPDC047074 TaxID=3154339 RepID=UPI0033F6B2D8